MNYALFIYLVVLNIGHGRRLPLPTSLWEGTCQQKQKRQSAKRPPALINQGKTVIWAEGRSVRVSPVQGVTTRRYCLLRSQVARYVRQGTHRRASTRLPSQVFRLSKRCTRLERLVGDGLCRSPLRECEERCSSRNSRERDPRLPACCRPYLRRVASAAAPQL